MKTTELRKKNLKQLQEHATDLAKRLAELPKQQLTSDSTNVKQQHNLRKEYARTLTLLTEKRNEEDKENA